jgi:hypothetical protein
LGMSGLTAEDVFRYPGLDGHGQAAHAAADAGETSGVHSNVCQGGADPLRYVGSGALGYSGGRGNARARVGYESGEQRGTFAAGVCAVWAVGL